jgi:hypothetical protein
MLKGLVSLKDLSIQGFWNLRGIESGAFRHVIDTLKHLCLENNRIKIVEPGAINCLSNLKCLSLSRNKLTCDELNRLKANGELPKLRMNF